ncbi:MAG: NADH-quinone oxidoreductase subunit N [Mucilaginibacter polytrichastri]|nr:NADH-quinone oxidoreductase subunit N [Mucilaginibacter polytrichastri]
MTPIIILSLLAILLLYIGLGKSKAALLPVTAIGLAAALGSLFYEWNNNPAPVYSGMMWFDHYAVAFSAITIFTTLLILLLTKSYFESISRNVAEYYTLILFSLTGILVMVSFQNLTMLFVGIEIMSVCLYILAGIRKADFSSNEASLKYFLMGAFSTGFLLFGIALLYGATGSFSLDVIKKYVLDHNEIDPLMYTGIALIIVGMSFKVGAAPFHFWTPDVYEGSPALITAFMSTVVKTAGFAAFLRLFMICFGPLGDFWMPVLMVISILTLFIGNITALFQTSFKRMMAYSSISHAGYMLFAILSLGAQSQVAVFVYAAAYSVASVVAFAVLLMVKKATGSDTFESFNGLGKSNPFMAFCLTVAMLSLAGIPLTAGFVGKFFMFSVALKQYHVLLVVLAVVNAIISIYYYFRVIVAMYFNDQQRQAIAMPQLYSIVLGVAAVITLLAGIYPSVFTRFF